VSSTEPLFSRVLNRTTVLKCPLQNHCSVESSTDPLFSRVLYRTTVH